MALSPEKFAATWRLLASYYGRQVDANILTLLYSALVRTAPELTNEQFDYAVEQAIATSRFMPTIAEVLSEVYEPLWRVRKGEGPQLPDIDPSRASEGLVGAYHTAQATRERWKQTQQAQAPVPGVFRLDRWQEIPGATLTPAQERQWQAEQRRKQSYIEVPDEVLRELLPPWERRDLDRRPDTDPGSAG